jgi:hypothetical protein
MARKNMQVIFTPQGKNVGKFRCKVKVSLTTRGLSMNNAN